MIDYFCVLLMGDKFKLRIRRIIRQHEDRKGESRESY
jgi:hypothetical protein